LPSAISVSGETLEECEPAHVFGCVDSVLVEGGFVSFVGGIVVIVIGLDAALSASDFSGAGEEGMGSFELLSAGDVVKSLHIALELLWAHSLFVIYAECFGEKFDRGLREVGREELMDGDCEKLPSQLFLGFGLPGSTAGEEFVVDDSYCPDVTLEAVLVVVEGLGRHVNRRPNIVGTESLGFGGFHGKPKIGYFEFVVFEEDVGGFEVSMDNFIAVDF
jgi:hypothetical protein